MRQNKACYIIAEVSSNHSGKLNVALDIVRKAAEVGADCVKLQTYTADTITIPSDNPEFIIKSGLWKGYSYYDLYKKAYTPWEWQLEIKKECDRCGVDFLSTPFDFTAVDFLESIGVEAYKIASYELIDIPLIKYTASKGKPIIISSGMGTEEEISDAIEACRQEGNNNITILKCCSEYPANVEDMNLSLMQVIRDKFNVKVGLSDHSFGYEVPILAVAAGAEIIEKHVMLDDTNDSVDKDFSMSMTEFAEMVRMIRRTESIMGKGEFELSSMESKGKISRRSLYAVRDIKEGEVFSSENIRSIRPGFGLKPKYYYSIIGRKATRDISYGTALIADMIEGDIC